MTHSYNAWPTHANHSDAQLCFLKHLVESKILVLKQLGVKGKRCSGVKLPTLLLNSRSRYFVSMFSHNFGRTL